MLSEYRQEVSETMQIIIFFIGNKLPIPLCPISPFWSNAIRIKCHLSHRVFITGEEGGKYKFLPVLKKNTRFLPSLLRFPPWKSHGKILNSYCSN
jgi:hypothetical protein